MIDKEIEIVKEAMLNPGKRFEVRREDGKIIITDKRNKKQKKGRNMKNKDPTSSKKMKLLFMED